MKELRMSDGMRMPVLGLGTWQMAGNICLKAVRDALRLGYKHIDTADIYGNHSEVGEAIKGHDRSGLFIATKVWRSDLAYDSLLKACYRALKEIATDYIDLYLIHWPNDSIPIKGTMKALNRLVEENKVRSIGISNFDEKRTEEALAHTEAPIVTNQVEFHPYLYQKELLEYAKSRDMIITAYSPVARGNISGDRILSEIGKKHGKTAGQVSLRWLVQHGMAVIPKSSGAHLKENMEIFDFTLSKNEIEAIDSLKIRRRLINPAFRRLPFFDLIPKPVIKFASRFVT